MFALIFLFAVCAATTLPAKCPHDTFIVGLAPNMTAVVGSSRHCSVREDCLKKLCEVNDYPGVAWVVFAVSS